MENDTTKVETISCRLKPGMRKALRELAFYEGVGVGDVVAEAIWARYGDRLSERVSFFAGRDRKDVQSDANAEAEKAS
jgi:hypothetical protein